MPLALTSVAVTRVRFIRAVNNLEIAIKGLTATPTVSRLTVPGQHGFIDLVPVKSVLGLDGIAYFDLVATDDEQVNETFGWVITGDGWTGFTRTVAVPQTGAGVTTLSVDGGTMPAVWLNELADFTGSSGATGPDTATRTYVDDAFDAHEAANDPHPQYAMDGEGGTSGIVLLNATGNGVADDTASINSSLATASPGATVRGVPGKSYLISSPLVTRDGGNQTVDMTGCTVTLKTGVTGCNLLRNAAVTAQRSVSDGAISSASTTLTSATAAWTSADVGRSVNVAGANVGPHLLTATIVSVTNSTTVVLDTAAGLTVSSAAVTVYNRDRNIRVTGGTWNRQNIAGSLTDMHNLMFRHLDGVTVGGNGMRILSAAGKYAVSFADVADYDADDIDFDVYSDGVHVMGPAYRGHIGNLYGYTRDDFVAFTPNDYSTYNDCLGWVEDCVVENLYPRNSRTTPLLINGGSAATGIRRIRARNINGSVLGEGRAFVFIFEGDNVNTTGGLFDDIVIEDVGGKIPADRSYVQVRAARLTRLRMRRVNFDNAASTSPVVVIDPPSGSQLGELTFDDFAIASCGANPIFQIGTGVTVDSLTINRLRNPSTLAWRGVYNKGTITDLTVRDVVGKTANHFLDIDQDTSAAGVTRLSMSDIHLVATTGSLLRAITSGHTLGRAELANMALSGMSWIGDLNTTTELHLSSVSHVSPATGILNARAAAVLTVRGDGNQLDTGGSGLAKASGATVTVKSFGIAVDASKVVAGAGTFLYNTNSGAAGGVGPVFHDGTTWQHLGAAGGAVADVQVFTSSGTWTKPTGAVAVNVHLIGGGCGGGSGRRGAAGTARGGGGGGGGGARAMATFRASDLASTVAVTVGAGAAGGASVTTDSTDGAAGAQGAVSTFGSIVRAGRGGGGGAGTTSGGSSGGFAGGMFGSTAGGAGGTGAAGANSSASAAGGCGGGGGAGISAADAVFAGGQGWDAFENYSVSNYAGAAGADGPTPTDRTANTALPGSGGGGGGSSITAASGNGGNGAKYGGGGGGGAASVNGFASGAGGSGAAGIVVVVTEV